MLIGDNARQSSSCCLLSHSNSAISTTTSSSQFHRNFQKLDISLFYTASLHYLRSSGRNVRKSLVGRTGGRTDTSPRTALLLVFSYNLPKTVTVTTLLLFDHVTLLCGKFLFIKLSQLSVCMTDIPAPRCRLIRLHWFGSPIMQP